MRLLVGITDKDWFDQLSTAHCDEVNFWRPGGGSGFAALQPLEPFLFKLHSPLNFVVGGGFFVSYSLLPVSLAWESFGTKNGVQDFAQFRSRIAKYRQSKGEVEVDPTIGCIILTAPFFFPREFWIPIPADWSPHIQTVKGYDTNEPTGASLWEAVLRNVQAINAASPYLDESAPLAAESTPRYGKEFLTQARLGQGAFRVLVTDAYTRRCAVTGEKTLPALEAAHIKPYEDAGPHLIQNGLLLRADLHKLFDRGLVTVTPDLRVEVSKRIREEWENGHEYYAYHGHKLACLPKSRGEEPSREFLQWHNESRFVG
jgi:putative restriction endonuclease